MTDPRETIKQLLRLAKDPSAAEAARALQKARGLAMKHRLSLEELNLEKDLEEVAEKAFPVGDRISYEHKLAALVAENHFNVRVVLDRPSMMIFGTKTDIIIAEYVIEYLVGCSRRCLSNFRASEKAGRRKWNSAKRANYLKGFFEGIMAKLQPPVGEIKDPRETAIVIATQERVESYVDEKYKNKLLKAPLPKSRRHRDARTAGFIKGKKTNIHDPLTASPMHQLQG